MKKKRKVPIELNISESRDAARIFLAARCRKGKYNRLLRFNEIWYFWKKEKYEVLTDEFFVTILDKWLGRQELYKYGRDGSLVSAVCSERTIKEILGRIITEVIYKGEGTDFFWLSEEEAYADSNRIIAFENGLFVVGENRLRSHTPNWFSTKVLPYSYFKEAKCPAWLSWLDDISGEDKDWVDCLQLWFGYNLVSDTSRQRFAHFYGPPRSGKGTATRVLSSILGRWNCANPTLHQLGNGQFGLAPLMGKLAAIVPDALIGRSADSKRILEALSTIIGEDQVDISRKYLSMLTGVKLNVRFTITSNEPLKWPDPTNKLAARSLLFPFVKSFVGKEDPSIEVEIMKELPGIANWALTGLKKLNDGAVLQTPKTGVARGKILSALDSPLYTFCDTCFQSTSKTEKHSKKIVGIPVTLLHKIWLAWNREEGRPVKGQTRTYVKSLMMTARPEVLIKKRGERGRQEPCYVGITLTEEGKRLLRLVKGRRRTVMGFKKGLGLNG